MMRWLSSMFECLHHLIFSIAELNLKGLVLRDYSQHAGQNLDGAPDLTGASYDWGNVSMVHNLAALHSCLDNDKGVSACQTLH